MRSYSLVELAIESCLSYCYYWTILNNDLKLLYFESDDFILSDPMRSGCSITEFQISTILIE